MYVLHSCRLIVVSLYTYGTAYGKAWFDMQAQYSSGHLDTCTCSEYLIHEPKGRARRSTF